MPQLSIDAKITFNDVSGITALAQDRPVFLIVADDRSNVVVKQENAPGTKDSTNLRYAAKAMGAVSAGAKGKLLTTEELDALKGLVALDSAVQRAINNGDKSLVRQIAVWRIG